ncbi:MAG: alanine--tRNA ligase-related protein, partial [Planctomycetota bacterium]
MKTDEIRRRFLDFFRAREHRIVPPDSLVPAGDPSLLFTGAGMNQFKDEFYGLGDKSLKRAAT